MIRRPPRSTQSRSSAASDVYKRQDVRDAPPGHSVRHRHPVRGRRHGHGDAAGAGVKLLMSEPTTDNREDPPIEIKTVGVVGCGLMGSGIAQAGYQVVVR